MKKICSLLIIFSLLIQQISGAYAMREETESQQNLTIGFFNSKEEILDEKSDNQPIFIDSNSSISSSKQQSSLEEGLERLKSKIIKATQAEEDVPLLTRLKLQAFLNRSEKLPEPKNVSRLFLEDLCKHILSFEELLSHIDTKRANPLIYHKELNPDKPCESLVFLFSTLEEAKFWFPILTDDLSELKSHYQKLWETFCKNDSEKRQKMLEPKVCLSGEGLGHYRIPVEIARNIVSIDLFGGTTKEKNKSEGHQKGGQNSVFCLGKKGERVHFKADSGLIVHNLRKPIDPIHLNIFPEIQWSVHAMNECLFGRGATPPSFTLTVQNIPLQKCTNREKQNEFNKLVWFPKLEERITSEAFFNRYTGYKEDFKENLIAEFFIQASETVEGIQLHEHLDKQEKIPLDSESTSSFILLSLLANFTDAKGDNIFIDDKGRIVAIDNDRCFGHMIVRVNNKHRIEAKNTLFLMKEMDNNISEKIRQDFLSLSPNVFLVRWLLACHEQNERYHRLREETGIGAFPDIRFCSNAIFSLRHRFKLLRKELNNGICTHQKLLDTISSIGGDYYKKMREREPDPLKATQSLWGDPNGEYKYYIEDIIENPFFLNELKKETASVGDYVNRTKTPKEALQDLFRKIGAKGIHSLYTILIEKEPPALLKKILMIELDQLQIKYDELGKQFYKKYWKTLEEKNNDTIKWLWCFFKRKDKSLMKLEIKEENLDKIIISDSHLPRVISSPLTHEIANQVLSPKPKSKLFTYENIKKGASIGVRIVAIIAVVVLCAWFVSLIAPFFSIKPQPVEKQQASLWNEQCLLEDTYIHENGCVISQLPRSSKFLNQNILAIKEIKNITNEKNGTKIHTHQAENKSVIKTDNSSNFSTSNLPKDDFSNKSQPISKSIKKDFFSPEMKGEEFARLGRSIIEEYKKEVNNIENTFHNWGHSLDTIGKKLDTQLTVPSDFWAPHFQHAFGVMYDIGKGFQQNKKVAIEWCKSAAKRGNAYAQNNLGVMYFNGEGIPQNKKEALRLYKLAAEQGAASAQYNLGLMYDIGEEVLQDKKEAARLYTLAAKQGHSYAQYNLAVLYDKGQGVLQDKQEALRLYTLSAKQGIANAQYNLAVLYYNGKRVSQDKKEALRLYKLAIEQGHSYAQNNLAVMYSKGEEVPQNKKEAARLYKLSADQGMAAAQYNLAVLYDNGEGVSQDKKEAVRLYELAVEQGHVNAQYNLAWLYFNGEGVVQDKKEAAKLFELAADQGHANAQYNLGLMYANGEGVLEDKKEAVRLFKLAEKKGHVNAQYSLGLMNINGEGVLQNKKEAGRLFKLAANQGHEEAKRQLKELENFNKKINKDFFSPKIKNEENTKLCRLIEEKYKLLLDVDKEFVKSVVFYKAPKGMQNGGVFGVGGLYSMGVMYFKGEGFQQDKKEAARLFKLASDQGYSYAHNNLGVMYANGEGGLQRNKQEAVRLLKLAAEQKITNAQYNLGVLYDIGEGVPQNKKEAAKLYKLSADQGIAIAQYNLAILYDNGEGVLQDKQEALRLYTSSAKQGVANAQYNLAVLYYNGKRVPQDKKEALKLYKLAVEQGHPYAQNNLAAMYSKGEEVSQNKKEAARLYKLSVDQGVTAAQYNLAVLYDNGEGVLQDKKEAAKLYKLAVEKGHVNAQFNLAWLYMNGEGVEQDKKEAARLFELAADQGHANAQYNLGLLYMNGEGVLQDKKEAVRLFKLAAKQEHPNAQYHLGLMNMAGESVLQNKKEAVRLFRLAANQGHEGAKLQLKELEN